MVALRLPLGGSWILRSKRLRERKEKTFKIFLKNFLRTPASNSHQSPFFHIRSRIFLLQFSSPSSCSCPFFHQIAVSKVRARKTFFRIFKNFFRPKLSFFAIFKTFSRPNADRVTPFHGEKARKTDNLHNRNSQKITLIWLKSPSRKYPEKNIQNFRKNFKKGVDFLKGVCYTT